MSDCCFRLPRATSLGPQVYEVDTDQRDEESSSKSLSSKQVTKQGWLYKGPTNEADASFISFTKVLQLLSL